MYIFISHSSTDAKTAQDLCAYIEENGNDCFLAPRDIRPGCEYAAEIIEGVDRSDAVFLVLSNASNQSPHVLREVERAVTRSIPILVYKIEDVELTKSMEYFLMTHQWMNSKKNSYADILENIEKLRSSKKDQVVNTIGSQAAEQADQGAKEGKVKKTAPNKKMLIALASVALLVVVAATAMAVMFSKNPAGGNSQVGSDAVVADVQLGDTVVMGTYNDADISWRVLSISEDQTEAVLVSEKVLTVKAYDSAESGKYNYDGDISYYSQESEADTDLELQAYVRGNSSWENSNIRTWLNSTEENVKYEGQAPETSAMADLCNGYNSEAGFLCGFTEEELEAIKVTTVETTGNALADSETVVTEDKVFLLSMEELDWFEEANVSILAEPTEEAIAKDQSYFYQDYCIGFGTENTMWWLREPVEGSSSQCYLIGNGYREENIYTWEVGVESFGIRPAITVDLTKNCLKTETP